MMCRPTIDDKVALNAAEHRLLRQFVSGLAAVVATVVSAGVPYQQITIGKDHKAGICRED